MADWYGRARSNYFKVKDMDKFKEFCADWYAKPIEKEHDLLSPVCEKCKTCKIKEDCEQYVKATIGECDGKTTKQMLVGFLGEDDKGSLPHFREDENTGVDLDFDDFLQELAKHLVDGWVAVMVEVGAEKLRYVTGYACAVNSKGKIKTVSIDEIYKKAENLGKHITKCEY